MPSTPSPCLLVLDTATEVAHVALLVHGQVAARALDGGAQASVTLLPALQALLAEAGLPWTALDAIAFGHGPGAFTGLRTACAVTQGLALGLERPVIALDTLMAVAQAAVTGPAGEALQPALEAGDWLWAVQDARMGEAYVAAYGWQDTAPVSGGMAPQPDNAATATDVAGVQGPAEASAMAGAGLEHAPAWRQLQPPALWPLAHLEAEIKAGRVTWAAGSALTAHPPAQAALGTRGDATAQPHGAALAALAWRAWARGELLDPALALPLYVRDKVAQTTQERQADRRAREATPLVAPGQIAEGVRPA